MTNKIPLVCVIYYNADEIRQTLESLFDDRFDIYCVENPTDRTPEIKAMCLEYLRQGKIKKYILFDHNIAHNAMSTVFNDGLIPLDAEFIISTDGDLIPEKGWLDQSLKVLSENDDVFTIGANLSMDNLPLKTFPDCKGWEPEIIADHGHYVEGYCGHHLLVFKMQDFVGWLNWRKQNNQPFLDTQIGNYCKSINKRWCRTKIKSIHWTWTLYQDANHPYTKYKLEFPMIWHNTNTSEYVVYDKFSPDVLNLT